MATLKVGDTRNFNGTEYKYTGGDYNAASSWQKIVEEESVPTVNLQEPFDDDPFKGSYGVDGLLRPDRLSIVDDFLKERYGVDYIDGLSPEQRRDKFVNSLRKGQVNSVRILSDLNHINSTDDKGRAKLGAGIKLFNGMANAFSEENTFGQKVDAVWDYASSAVLDPVNLLGGIVGKGLSTAGGKGAAAIAKKAATDAFSKKIAEGVSKQVAAKAARKVQGDVLREVGKQQIKRQAAIQIGSATAVDTAASVGMDYWYQKGMINLDVQEEHDLRQSGFAALGGLIGGGIAAGEFALRGTSKLGYATDVRDKDVVNPEDLKGLLKGATEKLKGNLQKNAKYTGTFKNKTLKAEELDALDNKFWTDFILGNDEEDFQGLAHALYEEGFRWFGKRKQDDNFSNWMADAIIHSPDEDKEVFVKFFEETFDVSLDAVPNAAEELANNMARKISDGAKVMNAASQAANYLSVNRANATVADYAETMLGIDIDGDIAKSIENIQFIQNSYIRLLVSNWGTSAMNVQGWAMKSAASNAADILAGAINSGGALLKGDVSMSSLGNAIGATKQRMLNTVDPSTTYDAFQSLIAKNPKRMMSVTEMLPGGVEKSLAKDFGFEDARPMLQQKADDVVDAIQEVALVKAQDQWTKSQEYMYQLDFALRELTGKSYKETLKDPKANSLIQSDTFAKAQAIAADKTLENIFSKSYGKAYGIGPVAKFVEDARNIPFIGIHVPFGRFFNNTLSTMVDFSPAGPMFRMAAGTKALQGKSNSEVLARAAVGTTVMLALVNQQRDYIERGIPWNEQVDESTGQKVDHTYTAPYTSILAGARLLAHEFNQAEGIETNLTEREMQDMAEAIGGQLTRNLNESVSQVKEMFVALVEGNVPEAKETFFQALKSTPNLFASGSTRFLEPVNTAIAMNRDPEDYKAVDFRQNEKWFAESLRYIDQIVLDQSEQAERVSPTSPIVERQPTKLLGVRDAPPATAASRLFAMVGRPDWDAGIRSASPHARAAVTKIFQPIMEEKAEKLLSNPKFLKAPTKAKKSHLDKVLKQAREETHDAMTRTDTNYRMSKLFKLTSNNTIGSLKSYLEEMGIEEELHELSNRQLDLLKSYVDSEPDRLERTWR